MNKLFSALFFCCLMISMPAYAAVHDVNNGQTEDDFVIVSGDTQNVNSGGKTNKTKVESGGVQEVNNGGTAKDTDIKSGGVQKVNTGGTAHNSNVEGTQILDAGSIISGTQTKVHNGGVQDILVGAEIGSSTAYISINDGGTQNVNGTVNYTRINENGVQNILSGGIANNSLIFKGGIQNVDSGGTAKSTKIYSGGVQVVNSGGVAHGTSINNGGTQNFNGGTTTGKTYINGGGIQNITSELNIGTGGTDSEDENWDVIYINGGTQNIEAGVTLTAAQTAHIEMKSGTQNIKGDADITGMTVKGNGTLAGVQNIHDTAIVRDAVIGDMGVQVWKSDTATMVGDNSVLSGGRIVFEKESIQTSGVNLAFDGGSMLLKDVKKFNADFKITGNGIINVTLRSADSDFYTFQDISGNFKIGFDYDAADANALNQLSSIDIIKNESTDKSLVSLSNLGNGIDIGIWNWSVTTDEATGITSAVKTNAKSYLAMGMTNHIHAVKSAIYKMTNSMQKRVGELQWLDGTDANQTSSGTERNNGAWVRGVYKSSDHRVYANPSSTLYGAEFGYDFKIKDMRGDKRFLGFMGYSSKADIVFDSFGLHDDKNELDAYGIGAYLIWLGADGRYADTALRLHLINQSATAWAAGAVTSTTFETQHYAATLNVDVGVEYIMCNLFNSCLYMNLTEKPDFVWFLKPYVELSASYITGDDFETSTGFNGRLNGGFGISVNPGVMAGPRWTFKDDSNLQVYAKTGLIVDASSSSSVTFAGLGISEKFNTSGMEIGGGLNWRSGNTKSTVFMDAAMRFGLDYDEFSGVMGLRFEF